MADEERIAQIQLPDPADTDPHPWLLVDGRGVHAGEWFSALFPDGWHDVTLEVIWELTGPGYWYISTPGFEDVYPVGLFVKYNNIPGHLNMAGDVFFYMSINIEKYFYRFLFFCIDRFLYL